MYLEHLTDEMQSQNRHQILEQTTKTFPSRYCLRRVVRMYVTHEKGVVIFRNFAEDRDFGKYHVPWGQITIKRFSYAFLNEMHANLNQVLYYVHTSYFLQ